jgi:hypothetical protein
LFILFKLLLFHVNNMLSVIAKTSVTDSENRK